MKKTILEWSDVFRLLDKIHKQVDGKVTFVTGIPRGGTILAILYSHRYGVEYLHKPTNYFKNTLILDDISDTGHTLKEFSKRYYNLLTACLYHKEGSIKQPHFYGEYLKKDSNWIVFPWERRDAENIQDYLVS